MGSYGSLYITGNTTPQLAANAGTTVAGWSNGRSGDKGAVPDAANNRLKLLPGDYFVSMNLSVETEDISGTSGDGVGDIKARLALNGTAITGMVARFNQQAVDRPASVSLSGIVHVPYDEDNNYGYLTAVLAGVDASGNDVTVDEAQLSAVKVG